MKHFNFIQGLLSKLNLSKLSQETKAYNFRSPYADIILNLIESKNYSISKIIYLLNRDYSQFFNSPPEITKLNIKWIKRKYYAYWNSRIRELLSTGYSIHQGTVYYKDKPIATAHYRMTEPCIHFETMNQLYDYVERGGKDEQIS